MANCYVEGYSEDALPDCFITGSVGGSKESLIEKVKKLWPEVEILDGITGICEDCGEYHFLLESVCTECGGIVNEY